MAIANSKRKHLYSLQASAEEQQPQQPQEPPLKRMKRNGSSVQFKTDVDVKVVPPKETYDKNALWYRDDSPNSSQDDLARTKKPLSENIQKLLDSVLDEQIEQWAAGVSNPVRLANASKKISSECQAAALKAGIMDRVAALQGK
eukprot:CAMPEP_0117030748 /NCGR_PEP_ID=MMETSP0472-20121206/22172_1 /TAXON_ID=693140 ORGANISM="Tiarina fusus, Strain LIS" /NCGR_SAMPLE_ID=MMETSP0472 /ASSEMBLY_ACC=CAM_ASM_000603 /LENGTH=143 /DNA_ID=CAMNT_0004738915 /DNA_START=127 /DNA_END=558 /DNA_ORIENTATION=+